MSKCAFSVPSTPKESPGEKRNHTVQSHPCDSGAGTLLRCLDHRAGVGGRETHGSYSRQMTRPHGPQRCVHPRGKRITYFSERFVLPDRAPGSSHFALCAVCSLRNRGNHPYRFAPTQGPGETWVSFRTTIHSRVNRFLSLDAGSSPQTLALSFLSSRPRCSQRIGGTVLNPGARTGAAHWAGAPGSPPHCSPPLAVPRSRSTNPSRERRRNVGAGSSSPSALGYFSPEVSILLGLGAGRAQP